MPYYSVDVDVDVLSSSRAAARTRDKSAGLCEEIAPDVFTLLDDGLAYVKEGDKVFSDPGGPEGLAAVPAGQEEAVIESAEECPGECIFIEM